MKTTMSIALLAIISLFAVACGSDTEATVTGASDDTDATVEEAAEEAVAKTANRIVSLSPTATEMLFAIGAGDQVIAVDAFSYYPEEAPVTDLSGFEPNVEAIAGFEPTLVVSSAPIEGLDAIDIENVVQVAAVTFDDVYSQIEQLGALTGNVGEAAELVLEMQTDIEAVVASLPERETPLTYYHELDNTLYSVTSSTFVGEVYSLLGLVNAADAADPDDEFFGYPQLNEEFLITADPDIIFLADTLCCAQNAETVADRPGWDQLSAVQAGNIVELDDDIVSRWGPRLVDFIETAGAAVVSVEAVPAS
jgi:iron complex transport system substrate-binding protein